MGRARQFLACILALILAAGLLQAPAVSMMSVFAAEAVETENAETDGNEDTAETSPIGEEEREDVIEGMSESHDDDQPAADDADVSKAVYLTNPKAARSQRHMLMIWRICQYLMIWLEQKIRLRKQKRNLLRNRSVPSRKR